MNTCRTFAHSTVVRWLGLAGLVVAMVLALLPSAAFAAETRGSNDVVIGPGETITDDLYIAGGTVTVLGTIQGDLVVFGGTVIVSGPVRGDVIAAGGTTTIQGPVGRNVRAAGGAITVASTVAQDVVVAGGNFTLGPEARVGRDLLAGTGTVTIDGAITRNVLAGGGDITLNGPVGGDVNFDGSQLRLTDRASVGGNLTYSTDNDLVGPVSQVRGQIKALPRAATIQAPTPVERAIDGIIGWGRAVVALFALGLVLVLLFPTFSRRTVTTLGGSPVASFVVGLIAFIAVPIAALLVFVVGLVIGGWWLGLVVLALYGIALAVGVTVAALYVGNWLLDRATEAVIRPVWALLVGVALLALVGLVPVIGGIIMFLALLFGGGSLLLTAYRFREETPSEGTSSITPGSGVHATVA